jgi:hypothetical protein
VLPPTLTLPFHPPPPFQAVQRTRSLLLQQGANRVLVNVLDELFVDGVELLDDIETTDFAVQVL